MEKVFIREWLNQKLLHGFCQPEGLPDGNRGFPLRSNPRLFSDKPRLVEKLNCLSKAYFQFFRNQQKSFIF
jgi:hypothetical protein